MVKEYALFEFDLSNDDYSIEVRPGQLLLAGHVIEVWVFGFTGWWSDRMCKRYAFFL